MYALISRLKKSIQLERIDFIIYVHNFILKVFYEKKLFLKIVKFYQKACLNKFYFCNFPFQQIFNKNFPQIKIPKNFEDFFIVLMRHVI